MSQTTSTTDQSLIVLGATPPELAGDPPSARQDIAAAAADLGSAQGLEGLSLSHLAAELEMSKSGLYAHFRSKEELQLAALEAAARIFADTLLRAASGAQPGLERLRQLLAGWLDYLESESFSGGCFFAAVGAEFDDRPGPIRDELVRLTGAWRQLICREIEEAQGRGELADRQEAEVLAFQLLAYLHEANRLYQLQDEGRAFEFARSSIAETLALHTVT